MSEKKNDSEEGPQQSKAKKWILGGAIALVLLGGGIAAGYLLGARNAPETPLAEAPAGSADSESAAIPSQASSVKGPVGPMVNIDSFIVNILDEQGSRYLKAAITLEVDGKEAVDEVTIRLPQVRDAILLHVGNKAFQELSDLQGKLQLRAELITRLNQILQKGKIQKIYFTDFVVQ
jgi:flagellar FliL protein